MFSLLTRVIPLRLDAFIRLKICFLQFFPPTISFPFCLLLTLVHVFKRISFRTHMVPVLCGGKVLRELFCTLSPNSSGFGDKILLEVWERRYGCRNSGRLCSGCSTALSSASNTPQRTKPCKRITRTGCYDGYDAETGTRKGSGYFTHSSADCCDALTWTLIAWKYDNL